MHRFLRGNSPINLTRIKASCQNWDDFCRQAKDEHAVLADSLYERQQHYCAYCESVISEKSNGFIEHLERRSDNPDRTFDWTNMFFSCKSNCSCGIYKDNSKFKFNPSDIIDPSREEPLDFFHYDMNGGIHPRDESHKTRAEETIRIFNLDNSAKLRGIRTNIARTVECFLRTVPEPNEAQIDEFLSGLGECDCFSVYYDLLGRKIP